MLLTGDYRIGKYVQPTYLLFKVAKKQEKKLKGSRKFNEYVTPLKENTICNIFYLCLMIVTVLEFILQNVPKELENL